LADQRKIYVSSGGGRKLIRAAAGAAGKAELEWFTMQLVFHMLPLMETAVGSFKKEKASDSTDGKEELARYLKRAFEDGAVSDIAVGVCLKLVKKRREITALLPGVGGGNNLHSGAARNATAAQQQNETERVPTISCVSTAGVIENPLAVARERVALEI
jgi:hypothetical protein